jgi:hypothetical protein
MRTRYTSRKEWANDLAPFDPDKKDYTERELELYTDVMLREAGSDPEHPMLFQEHIEPRWRKELNTASGTPEQAISDSTSADGQRMFNRQHPQGRKVNSQEQRRTNGASYYR